MSQPTRERLLQTARRQFAESGFEGVSIAGIASELGVTKQALLHHFGSKAKLYGEVLQEISDEFVTIRSRIDDNLPPAEALKRYLVGMLPQNARDTERARLLMRELLDNQRRAKTAKNWYLAEFLEELTVMTKAVPGWKNATKAGAGALVYQALGAINYYAVSGPTMVAIFGEQEAQALARQFTPQLETMIEATLSKGPTAP